jgi:hypothetical protein
MPGGSKLPRKMEVALAALLSESTIAAAATKAGLGERTLRVWLKTPIFAAAFKDRCRAVLDNATSILSAATSDAVATLCRNLNCGIPAVEIRAAAAILDHAFKAAELMDVVKRVEELERGPHRVEIDVVPCVRRKGNDDHATNFQAPFSQNGEPLPPTR